MTPATSCSVTRYHYPAPLRFIWHHIQPKEAGGTTTPDNLASLCDSCHYSIHRVLFAMAKNEPLPKAHKKQTAIALAGYQKCVTAGTVGKIPNEG